jgi:hypothetical protein
MSNTDIIECQTKCNGSCTPFAINALLMNYADRNVLYSTDEEEGVDPNTNSTSDTSWKLRIRLLCSQSSARNQSRLFC